MWFIFLFFDFFLRKHVVQNYVAPCIHFFCTVQLYMFALTANIQIITRFDFFKKNIRNFVTFLKSLIEI
jgi:hypothetical protein